MGEYSCDYRVYTKKIYIISGKVKKFKVQLLRSNALFLCRHEDTSSLRLFSDERSGRQIIRYFSSALLQRIEHCSMRKSTCRLPIYIYIW